MIPPLIPTFSITDTVKWIVIGVCVLAVSYLGYFFYSSGKTAVVAEVNSVTIGTLVDHNKKADMATITAEKEKDDRANDSHGFDAAQAKREAQIVAEKNNQPQETVVEQPTQPVTPPQPARPAVKPPVMSGNTMNTALSKSRIQDTWMRYCYYRNQDGLPCYEH